MNGDRGNLYKKRFGNFTTFQPFKIYFSSGGIDNVVLILCRSKLKKRVLILCKMLKQILIDCCTLCIIATYFPCFINIFSTIVSHLSVLFKGFQPAKKTNLYLLVDTSIFNCSKLK